MSSDRQISSTVRSANFSAVSSHCYIYVQLVFVIDNAVSVKLAAAIVA